MNRRVADLVGADDAPACSARTVPEVDRLVEVLVGAARRVADA
jgi:hypothetical protein